MDLTVPVTRRLHGWIDSDSEDTILRRVKENDDTLVGLQLGDEGATDTDGSEIFNSRSDSGYAKLGAYLAKNTHIKSLRLDVHILEDNLPLSSTAVEFFDGIKHNTSIIQFVFSGRGLFHNSIVGLAGQNLLTAFKENNNLTYLDISDTLLDNGGDHLVAATVKSCTNLKTINIQKCFISDKEFLPIADAISGNYMLEELGLESNFIGMAPRDDTVLRARDCVASWDGFQALATLLSHPNCNIHTINLKSNMTISHHVSTLIEFALGRNSSLRNLNLDETKIAKPPEDWVIEKVPIVVNMFTRSLCNTKSMQTIYSSNHTLERMGDNEIEGPMLASLLNMNLGTNKSHVIIKKILKYHPNMDMKSLFGWDAEEEENLKALPYIADWFERAKQAVADEEETGEYRVEEIKLSSIYQFVKAMPLYFVPGGAKSSGERKRKRDEETDNASAAENK